MEDALSRHGVFSATKVHTDTDILPGSKKHKDNMEEMCKYVIRCLK